MKNLFFTILAGTILSVSSAQAQDFFPRKIASAEPITPSKANSLPEVVNIKKPSFTERFTSAVSEKFTSITEGCKNMHFKFAQILNREVESISNTVLFGFIDDWWATKYRYGGTGRSGIDCSAYVGKLIRSVYFENLPRTAREQWASTERVPLNQMKEGDLVFFNTTGGVSHVGVYLGDGYFTHSSSSRGVAINNLSESYYKARFIGGGRINKQKSSILAPQSGIF